ncbi:MAG: anti-sigma factor family protein [Gemmatimonadota bacterium]
MPTDCSNIEMRELLPDFLHDTLSASERARVEAHLATCAECAAEHALLESARRAMAGLRVPRVDTAGIVAALPRPMAPAVGRRRTVGQRSPLLFRLAAAITFISLGGISVAIARTYFGEAPVTAVDSVMTWRSDPALGAPSLASADTPRAASPAAGLSVHPSIDDLGDADLESLLGELDLIEAAPLAEPESNPGGRALPVTISGS